MNMNTQKCKGCDTIKYLGEFYKDRNRCNGYSNRCKACENARTNKRYHEGKLSRQHTRQELENETEAAARLASTWRGKTQVPTPVGKADIVTADAVYEVKAYGITTLKLAIGQLLCYNLYLQKTRMVLVIWGACTEMERLRAEELCSRFNIEVVVEKQKYRLRKPRNIATAS